MTRKGPPIKGKKAARAALARASKPVSGEKRPPKAVEHSKRAFKGGKPKPAEPVKPPRSEPREIAPRRLRVAPPEGAPPMAQVPSAAELKKFLANAPGKMRTTEISRAFNLRPDQRSELRDVIRQLKAEGTVAPAGRRSVEAPLHKRQTLPDMCMVEVFGTDTEGDPLARPVGWQGEGPAPLVYMKPEQRGQPALAPGDRVLARIRPIGGGKYEGRTFKRIEARDNAKILGVVEGGLLIPTDRRNKSTWSIAQGAAAEGEIILAEPIASPGRHFGPRPVRVVEVLGQIGQAKSVSLICIHAHGIPVDFDPEAVAQAEKARGVRISKSREDLRPIPLITIDGEDARDFDDAVYAEPLEDGWKVIVAIADVAHYVTPGSALDRDARRRGNSVYFPDRVVPMLPEQLSNGWCSLRPNEDRGCLFVEMEFDKAGTKRRHRFGRGLMRSAARLTYEQAQEAHDAGTDPAGLPQGHVAQLYGAFKALLAERLRRGTLDLDIPERKVVLNEKGEVASVRPRARLDSHRLIEEFMVAANVCAAEELERLSQPCMYRVHDRPSDQKLEGLRQFLAQFDISLPQGDLLLPKNLAHALTKVKGQPHERLTHEVMLRSQSQAAYEPDNIGHFGLALARYAHFTSPIRRYADLLVHRALIRGLKLGKDGITEAEASTMPDTGEHITLTERRAALAERDAVDRYLAAFMAGRQGEVFPARISGVTRFGMFVTVEETGASGLVPFSALPDDRWEEDGKGMALVGKRTGMRFSLGDEVEVALREANALTGSLQFHLRTSGGDQKAGRRPKPFKTGRRRPGKA